MDINVVFLPKEISGIDLSDKVCIVLDIFRATTSITTAIGNGCNAIYPVISVEEAYELAAQTGHCLLAGERQSLKIDGFDLGNSPSDFDGAMVKGRNIIMTTTNGTIAIRATENAQRTLIGSFLNATAICQKIVEYNRDVQIVCAGTDRLFSLEDALCAGYLVDILNRETAVSFTDAAYAALLMYQQAKEHFFTVASNSRNGKRLLDIGRKEDIEYCFQRDILSIVPEYLGGKIHLL